MFSMKTVRCYFCCCFELVFMIYIYEIYFWHHDITNSKSLFTVWELHSSLLAKRSVYENSAELKLLNVESWPVKLFVGKSYCWQLILPCSSRFVYFITLFFVWPFSSLFCIFWILVDYTSGFVWWTRMTVLYMPWWTHFSLSVFSLLVSYFYS